MVDESQIAFEIYDCWDTQVSFPHNDVGSIGFTDNVLNLWIDGEEFVITVGKKEQGNG